MSRAGRIELVVPREAAGARLDRFLAAALAATDDAPSRSELQRWIENGRVRVDGQTKRAADKVHDGARIEVEPEPPRLTKALPEHGIAFELLFQDDQVLVIDKPAGLVVHPARGHESGTLVNALLALGAFEAAPASIRSEEPPESIADSRDPEAHLRPGIVHRLDKGTSGVMVVARTARAREQLKRQFHEHSIDREYEAIAVGDVQGRTFSTLHGRHPKDRLRFTTHVTEGKRAVTHVHVIEAFGIATHVACRLETGRTHQIRVHLAESGTPILADPLYGKPPKNAELRAIGEALGHQALHARLLGFTHPTTGERLRFESPPPADFQRALEAIRGLSCSARPR